VQFERTAHLRKHHAGGFELRGLVIHLSFKVDHNVHIIKKKDGGMTLKASQQQQGFPLSYISPPFGAAREEEVAESVVEHQLVLAQVELAKVLLPYSLGSPSASSSLLPL
jgi:hypothetical protein